MIAIDQNVRLGYTIFKYRCGRCHLWFETTHFNVLTHFKVKNTGTADKCFLLSRCVLLDWRFNQFSEYLLFGLIHGFHLWGQRFGTILKQNKNRKTGLEFTKKEKEEQQKFLNQDSLLPECVESTEEAHAATYWAIKVLFILRPYVSDTLDHLRTILLHETCYNTSTCKYQEMKTRFLIYSPYINLLIYWILSSRAEAYSFLLSWYICLPLLVNSIYLYW